MIEQLWSKGWGEHAADSELISEHSEPQRPLQFMPSPSPLVPCKTCWGVSSRLTSNTLWKSCRAQRFPGLGVGWGCLLIVTSCSLWFLFPVQFCPSPLHACAVLPSSSHPHTDLRTCVYIIKTSASLDRAEVIYFELLLLCSVIKFCMASPRPQHPVSSARLRGVINYLVSNRTDVR